MSTFKEGWCRTTHEAMLLKTPVIGSGQGGMRELLQGGGQIICEDFKNLRAEVSRLLDDSRLREEIGEHGYSFAKSFTMDKFIKSWLKLTDSVLK
jgi:glycosyltransferase involved in cell wall biosynthesis